MLREERAASLSRRSAVRLRLQPFLRQLLRRPRRSRNAGLQKDTHCIGGEIPAQSRRVTRRARSPHLVNDPNVACLHTLRNEFVQQTRPTQAELDELIETGAAQ